MNKAMTILPALLLAVLAAGCDGTNGMSMPKYEWKTLPGESMPRLVRVEEPAPAPQPAATPATTPATKTIEPALAPRPKTPPVTAIPIDTNNDALDGSNLRIFINDYRARKPLNATGEPIFTAPPVEIETVFFKFEYQKSAIGELTNVRISIYPKSDKAPDRFYKPMIKLYKSSTTYPLTPLKLVSPDGITDVKSLPKGTYILRLRVMGSHSFEQQAVEFTVE
ncbi:MAG: hypothetical protein HN909_05040 [Phycisphaerales bacterium]|jgi:hypothetical protein|nr:hypothetical protein [Phycisphaerales bacterium]MBT7171117.1 hypothetical protein [Phycisphaerales bacterium]